MQLEYLLSLPTEELHDLLSLDFTCNDFGSLDAYKFQALCDVLPKCRSLRQIDFCRNNLGNLNEVQIQALFNALSQCHSLRNLGLGANKLGDLNETKFQALCDGLSQCHSLQTLDLWYNNLGNLNEVQIQALFNALSQCHSLRHLGLGYTNIENLNETKFQALCDGLSKCHSLQTLLLGGEGNIYEKLNERQRQQLQKMIEEHYQGQLDENRKTAKTFLLSWNRLAQQEAPDCTLGSLSKNLIMKILDDAGFTHNAEAGIPRLAYQPLTLKFS